MDNATPAKHATCWLSVILIYDFSGGVVFVFLVVSFQYIVTFAFGGDSVPDAVDFGGYLVTLGDVADTQVLNGMRSDVSVSVSTDFPKICMDFFEAIACDVQGVTGLEQALHAD